MTLTDRLHSIGFKAERKISGEVISVQGQQVVACINTEPRFLEMLESGYLDKEPVSFEIEKGTETSTAMTWVVGQSVPSDLRGVKPVLNKQLVSNTYARKMVKIHDASDRWIITTIIDNVKQPYLGR